MELGQAYQHSLPKAHRKALTDAAVQLLDDSLQQLALSFATQWDPTNWLVGNLLPERFIRKYTGDFARRFFFCLSTMVWKLGQPEIIQPSCVAEELALHVLVDMAERILGSDSDPLAFGDFLYDDMESSNMVVLYGRAMESELSPEDRRSMNLTFNDWFKPYHDSSPQSIHTSIHPYSHASIHPYHTTVLSSNQTHGTLAKTQEPPPMLNINLL